MSEIQSDSNRKPNNPTNPTAPIPTGWEDMTVARDKTLDSSASQEPQIPPAQARGGESVNSEGAPTNHRLEAEPDGIKQQTTGKNSTETVSNFGIEDTGNHRIPQDSAEQLKTTLQLELPLPEELDIRQARAATKSAVIPYEREIETIKEKIRALEKRKENLVRVAEGRPGFEALIALKNEEIGILEKQKKELEEDLNYIVSMCDSFVAKAEKKTKNQNSAAEMSPTTIDSAAIDPTAIDPTTANQ